MQCIILAYVEQGEVLREQGDGSRGTEQAEERPIRTSVHRETTLDVHASRWFRAG